MKYLTVEFLKNKRRKFIYPLIIITCLVSLWFHMTMMKAHLSHPKTFEVNQDYLIMNFITFNGVFAPVFLSVLASQISVIEFKNRTWNVLSVNNQSKKQLFNAKFMYGIVIIFFYCLIEFVVANFTGKLINIDFNGYLLLLTILGLFLAMIVMFIFQLMLSFFIDKQFVGIVVGIAGSFIALMTSGLLPEGILMLLPVEYVALASPVKIIRSGHIGVNNHFLFNIVFILMVGIILFAIAQLIAKRNEGD